MLLLMIVWGWVASILTDIYSTPWLSITSLVMSLHKSLFVYNLKTVARVAADLEGYFLSFLISLKGFPGNILQGKRKSEEKLQAVLFFIQLYLLT